MVKISLSTWAIFVNNFFFFFFDCLVKTRLKSHYLNQIFQIYFQKISVRKLLGYIFVKMTKNYKISVLLGLNMVYVFVMVILSSHVWIWITHLSGVSRLDWVQNTPLQVNIRVKIQTDIFWAIYLHLLVSFYWFVSI